MKRVNWRGYKYLAFEKEHLRLKELIVRGRNNFSNKYLYKNIPAYPRPEFHVSHLKHDTNQAGLRGITRDSGFRNPERGSVLWWSLTVTPDEVSSAERRLLEERYPDRTEEQVQRQESFLGKFLTSPAFDGTSRLGSYRFTFTVEQLLKAYSDQFCSGDEPIMRVHETRLYKKEVMYVVLVHSPEAGKRYSDYPLLTDNPDAVCSYRDGRFIWRAQAISGTHRYRLIHRDNEKLMAVEKCSPEFYVWDHVAIALHVNKQVLNFDPDCLRENLSFCKRGYPPLIPPLEFQEYADADYFVKKLWPDCSSPLRR